MLVLHSPSIFSFSTFLLVFLSFHEMSCVCHWQNGGCTNPVNVINFFGVVTRCMHILFSHVYENVFMYVLFIYLLYIYLSCICKRDFFSPSQLGDWWERGEMPLSRYLNTAVQTSFQMTITFLLNFKDICCRISLNHNLVLTAFCSLTTVCSIDVYILKH